jgi:hypothetical protein
MTFVPVSCGAGPGHERVLLSANCVPDAFSPAATRGMVDGTLPFLIGDKVSNIEVGDVVDDLEPGDEADEDALGEVAFAELARAQQTSELPAPRSGAMNLPLGDLDPEVLERLAAEMIKRQPNMGAHFYGRRGQKQHGLDVLEREAPDSNSVYQVRRYEALTPDMITSAVTEYVDPEPPTRGPRKGIKPTRRFGARRYVLFTSAEFETETALQERLEELQEAYAGDLIIEVWGREMVSGKLRDSGPLVNSVFGPEWARSFCGFAPPPPDPADPVGLGLVENPVQVLRNLSAMAEDARALEGTDAAESARFYGLLAEALDEANFPGHAIKYRRQQARLLRGAGKIAGAFAVLWDLARDHFVGGATSGFGFLYSELDELRADLDELQIAKLELLTAVQAWYERGSQFTVTVPALEVVAAQHDRDAAFLACVVLEQALVDGWYDYDPLYSLVTMDSPTTDILAQLRKCAAGQSSSDVVIRARLACALADTELKADSPAEDVQAAYAGHLERAGAGRYREAGGLIAARAARAFAMHGDTDRAIDLWRRSILWASESRLYGDVLGCRGALNAAILEHPVPAFDELDYPSALPNTDQLLATDRSAELDALRAAHDGKLPEAFGVSRRGWWEARLSGHLSDERAALELFGDVLHAAGEAPVAVTAWVMAGASEKAADSAKRLDVAQSVEAWIRSPARRCQAAAARVIGAQARLYDAATAEVQAYSLLALTGDLLTAPRIEPNPALDAVNALCKLGVSLPASAVDPVLELVQPWLAAGSAVIPEVAELLVQLYWAVPSRREDLAEVIASQAGLPAPPPLLWEMIANLPEQAREPLAAAVGDQADGGSQDAIRTLVRWKKPTAAVQLAARRTCASLLRHPAGELASVWSVTTRFRDAAMLAAMLSTAIPTADVDPRDLRPEAGPELREKILFSMFVQAPGSTPPAAAGSAVGEVIDPESWEPDEPSLLAAADPHVLAVAVADYLLSTAESSNPPVFVRADALVALDQLQAHLPADVNARHAGRLFAIASNPALNALDQAEIASSTPLSRGQLNLGARDFPSVALVMAAAATASAAQAGADPDRFMPEMGHQMIASAMQLLRGPDPETAVRGAVVLALAQRYAPGLPDYSAALAAHPNPDVRAVAAARAVLDTTTQRVLVTDPSAQVRVNLAGRASELDPEVITELRSDAHPGVQRALVAATG